MFTSARSFPGSIVLLTTLAVAANTVLAVDLGPGIISTTGADTGDRLNVDQSFTMTLGAGTYAVSDFSYYSTAAGGGTVPFLSTSSAADTYDLLWIGAPLTGTLNATMSVNPAGFFTLAAPTTVYGGIYNTGGGRVAFGTVGGNTVDHDGAFTAPLGGVSTGTFSNPNLARTYAFKISVDASPMLTLGPGFLSNGGLDGGDRLNIDQAHPLTLSAGQYNVDDFSFLSMAAAGSVTPFLARLNGTDSYETVWVGTGVTALLGDMAVDPSGGFTLSGSETLYAGFYTANGGRVAFTEGVGRPPGFGVTDHDADFVGPTSVGTTVTGFGNPDLARTYSFSVGVTAVPEPGCVGLLVLGGLFLGNRRRRG